MFLEKRSYLPQFLEKLLNFSIIVKSYWFDLFLESAAKIHLLFGKSTKLSKTYAKCDIKQSINVFLIAIGKFSGMK